VLREQSSPGGSLWEAQGREDKASARVPSRQERAAYLRAEGRARNCTGGVVAKRRKEFFKGFRFTSFHAFLEYLASKLEQGFVVAIDEFQRLVEVECALSLLQKFWDERFSRTRSTLI